MILDSRAIATPLVLFCKAHDIARCPLPQSLSRRRDFVPLMSISPVVGQ